MKNIAAAISMVLIAGAASAGSNIHLQTGTYYGVGLFDDPASFAATVEGVITTSTWAASYDNLPVTVNNGALKSTITFDATTGGDNWTFREGVDFGKGGAVYLDGILQQAFNNNMWWNYEYSDSDQYFQFTANGLGAGRHTLTTYGLEDCCSGNQQAQFSINGGDFVSFGANDNLPLVPEAPNAAMLLAGLALVATIARRRVTPRA